jgi:hypothetical protein
VNDLSDMLLDSVAIVLLKIFALKFIKEVDL